MSFEFEFTLYVIFFLLKIWTQKGVQLMHMLCYDENFFTILLQALPNKWCKIQKDVSNSFWFRADLDIVSAFLCLFWILSEHQNTKNLIKLALNKKKSTIFLKFSSYLEPSKRKIKLLDVEGHG